jgi:glutathione S-transferase
MILIGQYDSPFVRRVGIALTLYGIAFELRPWSTFGDADKIRPYNPLTRVPTLVLDDGEVLIESHLILDYLDSLAPQGRAMAPKDEPARHQVLKVAALATGLADKAVSLFYEKNFHRETSDLWTARCRLQMSSVLKVLETDRAARSTPYWFGTALSHADIAAAVALRFVRDAHAGMIELNEFPALTAHLARCEALPVFATISQPFIPPKG